MYWYCIYHNVCISIVYIINVCISIVYIINVCISIVYIINVCISIVYIIMYVLVKGIILQSSE